MPDVHQQNVGVPVGAAVVRRVGKRRVDERRRERPARRVVPLSDGPETANGLGERIVEVREGQSGAVTR